MDRARTAHALVDALALSIAILLSFSSSDKSLAQSPSRRTNILFCFADDWGRFASCYKNIDLNPTPNSLIKTPNIDSIAARGVLFRNAFVPAPSCTPCRSSILSGRYFFNTGRGAILQGAQWDDAIPSFPKLLMNDGYQIGKSAKVWSPGNPADAPIGRQRYAFQKAGMEYNEYSEVAMKAISEGTTAEATSAKLRRQVRDNFEQFLSQRDSEKPFFFWFGPTNVHRKWVKGSGKSLWGIEPDSLSGRLPPFLPDTHEVRQDFADYMGEIQAFDAYIGELLDALKQSGELEHTLVVVSGDHGPPGFTNGKCNLYDFGTAVALVAAGPSIPGPRIVDDIVNLMDLAPTFLDVGGVALPDGLNSKSLWPILKSEKSGLVEPGRTWVITGRERHVAAAREDNLPYPQRALRTTDFLYIRNFAPDRWPLGTPNQVTDNFTPNQAELENDTFVAFSDMDASPTKSWLIQNRDNETGASFYKRAFERRPAEELYDLRKDPHQMLNVAQDPEYEQIRDRLATKLDSELRQANDPRLVETPCRFELPPYAGTP